MFPEDYIWKIQSPDGLHYYGSVEGLPNSGNVRMIKSNDAGATWTTQIVNNEYSYVQTIGFLDTLAGWTGGHSILHETKNGGMTWELISVGSDYNRFFRMNDSTAYLSGEKIYKYQKGQSNNNPDPKAVFHSLGVSPNPTSNMMHIDVLLRNKTYTQLRLYSAEGKLLNSIHEGTLQEGERHFSIPVHHLPAQNMYLVMKTNEGLVYKKVVKM